MNYRIRSVSGDEFNTAFKPGSKIKNVCIYISRMIKVSSSSIRIFGNNNNKKIMYFQDQQELGRIRSLFYQVVVHENDLKRRQPNLRKALPEISPLKDLFRQAHNISGQAKSEYKEYAKVVNEKPKDFDRLVGELIQLGATVEDASEALRDFHYNFAQASDFLSDQLERRSNDNKNSNPNIKNKQSRLNRDQSNNMTNRNNNPHQKSSQKNSDSLSFPSYECYLSSSSNDDNSDIDESSIFPNIFQPSFARQQNQVNKMTCDNHSLINPMGGITNGILSNIIGLGPQHNTGFMFFDNASNNNNNNKNKNNYNNNNSNSNSNNNSNNNNRNNNRNSHKFDNANDYDDDDNDDDDPNGSLFIVNNPNLRTNNQRRNNSPYTPPPFPPPPFSDNFNYCNGGNDGFAHFANNNNRFQNLPSNKQEAKPHQTKKISGNDGEMQRIMREVSNAFAMQRNKSGKARKHQIKDEEIIEMANIIIIHHFKVIEVVSLFIEVGCDIERLEQLLLPILNE